MGALPCGCPRHARVPPADTGGSSLCPVGWLFPGECAGARRGRAKAAKMLLLEGEVGGGETRGDQRREGDVEKKQKGTSSGPPLVSLLRVGNEAGDSGRSAWTPFSCGSAPLPATCGCICCCNKPSLPAPSVVCLTRANPATGWVEEGETQPLGTQAGTRGSRGCLQRLR